MQPVHETHRFVHRVISWVSVTPSRLLLRFLQAALMLHGCERCNRKRSTAHSMDCEWPSSLLSRSWQRCQGGCCSRSSHLGLTLRVTLPYVHAQLMDSFGFAPLSQDAQCLVLQLLWEVDVGYSAEARQCHSHRQLVFFFWLWRTGINLQRSQFTILF